jgi:hypothetical protein
LAALLHGLLLLVALAPVGAAAQRATLPDRLTDQEFWALSQESSEPGGYFRSADITNLTSNELLFQHVIPDLVTRVKPGSAYLGVGPEQNYTYMVATRPAMAIIVDIRRGNLALQLMYKAIFELSKDRADFVSMLFSKPRPPGLVPASTAHQIFASFAASDTARPLYDRNLTAIKNHLLKTHRLPLVQRDLDSLEAIYQTFFASGYYIRSSPSYSELMTATDAAGVERSYLATEAGFLWLKDLQARHLVVPVVGDFGGPKAIRAIGQYLGTRNATVGAFYLSNVEQYLQQDGKYPAFCQNLAALPITDSSTFIRSESGRGGFGRGGGFVNSIAGIASDLKTWCR